MSPVNRRKATQIHLFDPRSAALVRPSSVLLLNCMAGWMTAFMITSINVALPSIQTELRLNALALGWLPLGYLLISAAFTLPLARLADRHGRHLVFFLGLAVFGLGCLGTVFVHSYATLLGLRLAQGLGAALMFSTCLAMVALVYPPHRRGWAMGVSSSAAYLGQITGPIFGGVIVHNLGWRSLFLVAACFALFNVCLDFLLLRRAEWREEHPEKFDHTGSLVYVTALVLFLAGLSSLPATWSITLTGLGVVGLVAFGWWESRVRDPLLPLHLFVTNRTFTFSSLTAVINYSSAWGMTFLMSLYLQFVRGLNPQTAGFVLIPGIALQCLTSPLGGRLSDRIQPRWVASLGMGLCTLGLLLLSLLGWKTPYWYIITALCLLGLGYAFFAGPNQSAIVSSVERRYLGFASAAVGTLRMVGQAMSIAVATLLLGLIVGQQDIQPQDYPEVLTATRVIFALFTCLCALGIGTSLVRGVVRARPGERAEDEQPLG